MDQHDAFLQYCQLQGLSRRTLNGIRSALKIYIRSCPEPFDVTDQQVLQFFSSGRSSGFASDKPASPSHYNNIRKYLKKFYAWAVDYGYTIRNPILKIPACRLPKRLPRRLNEEQAAKVLYHARHFPHSSRFLRARNYALIATLVLTGLRAQEALHLREEDVCLEDRRIRVRHGKGDKERLVFFNSELLYIFRDYLLERTRLKRESAYFFVSYGSLGKMRYKNLRAVVQRISQRAGFHFTAHQLRHTCFSILAERGVDITTIQAQAGHTSIATTQQYLYVTDRHRKATMRSVSFL